LAGKGYVNLLLSQDKNSRDPGDNKEMVQARKRFLDKGYYSPLAHGLSKLLIQLCGTYNKDCVLLDAGCGDGYYTHHLQSALSENGINCSVYGMDISKEAIRLAAGRNKDIHFMVGSLFKVPFSCHQADLLLNAFAPACDKEFSRVLKKDGYLITVIPGREHLLELKAVLYDQPYENDEKEPDLPSFKSEEQIRIKANIEIYSQEDLSNLVVMTPYYWRTPKEGLERLRQLGSLKTTIEFIIGLHTKH
jgi:23S rRNA (guanine745-N1)-methyltransferase